MNNKIELSLVMIRNLGLKSLFPKFFKVDLHFFSESYVLFQTSAPVGVIYMSFI